MAFKMKNPSMAKLTKAAGDNRAAMKMKMEEKAAAKMKRESAMKMEKESMAKLMDKASAMKLKDGGPGTTRITDKDLDKKQKIEDAANKGDKMAKLVRRYNALGPKALSPEELKMIGKSSPKKMKKESPVKKDGEKDKTKKTYSGGKPLTGEDAIKRLAVNEMRTNPGMTMKEAMKIAREIHKKSLATPPATKMKKESSMKMGHKSATKLKKPSPAKQKMNMVKGPDGKMVPDFAVDGKGANDMNSATKMKPGKQERKNRKIVRRLKKGLKKGERSMKGKTPGTGMIFNEKVKEDLKKLPKAAVPMKVKKKDSGVKMVKRVDPKVNKLKEMKIQQPKPLPNKGRVTPKPTKQIKIAKMKPMKPVKMPKVTARF
jgi:hypothetical protein